MPRLTIFKKLKETILCSLVLVLVFFICFSLYNLSEKVFAQEELPPTPDPEISIPEESKKTPGLYCNPEIPIGEALEDTVRLLAEITNELKTIEQEVPKQIQAAENLIFLVNQCDVDKCDSVCEKVTKEECGFEQQPIEECPPGTIACQKWVCHDYYVCETRDCEGHPCPMDAIICETDRAKAAFEIIKASAKRVRELVDVSSEVRLGWEGMPLIPLPPWFLPCPAGLIEVAGVEVVPPAPGYCATKKGLIKEKLYKARGDFQKCFTPSSEWKKSLEEDLPVKMPFNCRTVLEQDLPRWTRKMEILERSESGIAPGIEEGKCKSLHNYFCCF